MHVQSERSEQSDRFHKKRLIPFLTALVLVLGLLLVARITLADSTSSNFESPTYTTGSPDAQDGWASTGSASPTCSGNTLDHSIVANIYGYATFGGQTLRISNAVTCGSFGNQTFSKPLVDEAGETSAYVAAPSGARQPHFVAQWDFASTVPGAEQPGLSVVASPDRGDGGRMSWVQMVDTPAGLEVNFYDYQDAPPYGSLATPTNGRGPEDKFVLTNLASALDRTVPHTVKIEMLLLDGPRNDIVRVYVDGTLRHTGTSWEDYFRWAQGPGDPEQTAPVRESRVIRSMLFRTAGTAVPATAGKGFVVDNVSLLSGPVAQCTSDCYVDAVNGNDAFGGTSTTDAKKTIQAGINQVSSGGTVHVAAGTYNENLNINKPVTLRGANYCVNPNACARGSESIVNGLATVNSDNVTINGFLFTNPSGSGAISAQGRSFLIITNNIFDKVGTTSLAGPTHAVAIVASGVAVSDITVSYNKFTDIHGGANPALSGAAAKSNNGSASAITVGWSNAAVNVQNLLIKCNNISNVKAPTAPFADGGKGAYGILINVGSNGIGQVNSPQILNNLISQLEGLWSHGIGLEGNTPNALVQGNTIQNLLDHKSPPDAIAVFFEQNASAATALVQFNIFENLAWGVAVVTSSTPIQAMNNWWGHASGPSGGFLDPVTATPANGSGVLVGPAVRFDPWLGAAPVTAIELISFQASASGDSVNLDWVTGTEINNAGFNLYRADVARSNWTQVNSSLIAAHGNEVSGGSYTFSDRPGTGTFQYILEDLDTDGTITRHDPVTVTVGDEVLFTKKLYLPTVSH